MKSLVAQAGDSSGAGGQMFAQQIANTESRHRKAAAIDQGTFVWSDSSSSNNFYWLYTTRQTKVARDEG
jgi:hypothetical protein